MTQREAATVLAMLDPNSPRYDFSVEEESFDIFVAARADLKTYRTKKQRSKAAHNADLIIYPLAEDAAFNGRVVLGPLDASEEAEWVTRSTARLALSDGAFVIDNGPYIAAMSEREREVGESFQCFQAPPGDYLLTIYAMLSSVNGADRLPLAATEGFLSYWNQSRPGKRVPAWLVEMAEDNDEEIPDDTPVLELNPERLIDFVFQLTPLSEEQRCNELRADGSLTWEARRPEECPRGIQSTTLAKYRKSKRKRLLEKARETENQAQAERQAHEAEMEALKQERTAVYKRLAPVAEAFRSKNWDGIRDRLTEGIREQFLPFVTRQMERLSREGKQLDPINPLVEGVFPTRDTHLESWQLEDEFTPPSLLDREAVQHADHYLDIIWNFRDPKNNDVFDQSHRIMVVLLVVVQGDTEKIAGVTIE